MTNFVQRLRDGCTRRTASGNAAPLRTLQGAATELSFPAGIAVDTVQQTRSWWQTSALPHPCLHHGLQPHRERRCWPAADHQRRLTSLAAAGRHRGGPRRTTRLLVANTHSITVYSRLASGNVEPLRTISGPASQAVLLGIAVDPEHDEVLVTSLGDQLSRRRCHDLPPDGQRRGRRPAADPERTGDASGQSPGHRGRPREQRDPGDEPRRRPPTVPPSITVYSRTPSGADVPLRTLSGGATELASPRGLAVDTVNDELIVVNLGDPGTAGDDAVRVYGREAHGGSRSAAHAQRRGDGDEWARVRRREHSCQCPPPTFDFDFSGGRYVDCFRELLRGSEISDGPDVGGTGHFAVDFKGGTEHVRPLGDRARRDARESRPRPDVWRSRHSAPTSWWCPSTTPKGRAS